MFNEPDYLVCLNCETPTYTFELDGQGKVVSAFCATCANDNPAEFATAEQAETGGEE